MNRVITLLFALLLIASVGQAQDIFYRPVIEADLLLVGTDTVGVKGDIHTLATPLSLDSTQMVVGRVFSIIVGNNETVDSLIAITAGAATNLTFNLYSGTTVGTATDSLLTAAWNLTTVNGKASKVVANMRGSGGLGYKVWWFSVTALTSKPDMLILQLKGHNKEPLPLRGIAFDAVVDSNWSLGYGTHSIDIPFTVSSNTNQIMIALIQSNNGGGYTPTDSIKRGSQKFVFLDSLGWAATPASSGFYAYYLMVPSVGTENVTPYIPSSGSPGDDTYRGGMTLLTYCNVNQGGGASSIELASDTSIVEQGASLETSTFASAIGEVTVSGYIISGFTPDSVATANIQVQRGNKVEYGAAWGFGMITSDKVGSASQVHRYYTANDGRPAAIIALRLKPL